MALQGTIDAFPLTDVLQLLSSSSKSGRLLLDGDRGRRELWIEQGSVIGGSHGATDASHMVLELLRFDDGSFTFDVTDGRPGVDVDPEPLEACLGTATELLSEWRRIEEVVPSMRHTVGLTEVIDDEVTLSAKDWTVVAGVGDRPEVGELALRLGLDEFACGAVLAELVQRCLVVVHEPRDGAVVVADVEAGAVAASSAPVVDPADLGESAAGSEEFPERFPIDDLLGGDEPREPSWQDDGVLEGSRFAAAQTFEPLGVEGSAEDDSAMSDPAAEHPWAENALADRTAEAWDEVVAGTEPMIEEPWQELPDAGAPMPAGDDGTDEVLRQMSRLSPKAAEAIAAALTTSADPGAVAAVEPAGGEQRDNDGPVSFMGSF